MKGHRGRYVVATASLGLAASLKTATYLLIRYLIDTVLAPGRIDLLPIVAAGFVVLALLEGTFTFLSGRLAAETAESIALQLRNYIYDHIQRLTFAYHDRTPTGDLIQRATSDVDAVRRFFAEQAIAIGRILLLFLVNWAVIFSLSSRLALLSVVVIPLIVLLSYIFFKRIYQAYEAYQEQEAVVSSTLQENLSGIRVVKAFARQPYESEQFRQRSWKYFLLGRRHLTIHSVYWPFTDILIGGQLLAGFLAGALMAIEGTISVGTYLAYIGMVIWIVWPMRNLGRLIVQMSTAMVSFGRIAEVLQVEREPLTTGAIQPKGNLRGEVEFEQVGFLYGEGLPALQEISFRAEPGQVIALMGSTGSGKSTLVNLLPRFYEYNAGRILLDGRPLENYPRKYLRSQIGIVEQEPFLFARTIKENIAYGVERSVTDDEVVAAARAAEIHDVIKRFPQGYQTMAGERGVTLSGGQKQRVAIARALLKDPSLLILDDATSAVDTETEARIRAALERLMQRRTTFIITHRVQSTMNADLILVLDRGRIVQSGAHERLLEEEGPYQRIFALQSRIEAEIEKEVQNAELL